MRIRYWPMMFASCVSQHFRTHARTAYGPLPPAQASSEPVVAEAALSDVVHTEMLTMAADAIARFEAEVAPHLATEAHRT